jgi:hypothetical protein
MLADNIFSFPNFLKEVWSFKVNSRHQKHHQQQMLARMWEKDPSYTAGGNASWCNHSGKQYGDFLKI